MQIISARLHTIKHMKKIEISENPSRGGNLVYIFTAISDLAALCGAKCETRVLPRPVVELTFEDGYEDCIRRELSDRIGDVFAINYKYSYFKENIKCKSLPKDDREILYCALISADLDDDKALIRRLLPVSDEYTLDGIYNFILSPLKTKWEGIVGYIPDYFGNAELKEFVRYLLDGREKVVYIDGGKVYDNNYTRLNRSALIESAGLDVFKEVILSGSGAIELYGALPKSDERYISEYYGARVFPKSENRADFD